MNTAVVLIIFNRPETTQRVFAEIARAAPPKLFVVADGPRTDRPGESERCQAARAIVDRIDWPCDVYTNFSDTNMGSTLRIPSGLDWVFDHVDEAIILEDDCLPHHTFFPYCEELLARYRHNQRIMHIGGTNLQLGYRRNQDSYYFSRYAHVWGWASWRRAWNHFDLSMSLWPEFRDGGWLQDLLQDPRAARYFQENFQSLHQHNTGTWAVPWLFACWVEGTLSIVPNVNLIHNLGFGVDATRTTRRNWIGSRLAHVMRFPLQHPDFVVCNQKGDRFTQRTIFRSAWIDRIEGKIWQIYRACRYE